jgi:starch synthase (maltosyl-transferring)
MKRDRDVRPAPGGPPRILILDLRPSIDAGRFPVKRIAGRPVEVQATLVRDGHVVLRGDLCWRGPGETDETRVPLEAANPGLDLWKAVFTPDRPGTVRFTVEAWTDVYRTWLADFSKRAAAALPVAGEALEGAALLETAAGRAKGSARKTLEAAAAALARAAGLPAEALRLASDAGVLEAVDAFLPRQDFVRHEPELRVEVDRPRARFGAWYELFPRSQGSVPGKASTFREAEARLPDLRDMGFDVIYLPPIHPIGVTARKGRNNSLRAAPGDPGSPWAIGSRHGGHDAVEPSLGTLEDFDHFVAAARDHGLEIALDFAVQCSPDHPWVKDHPEWFYRRPDGSIKFAENPPKKYEDIYPLDFDSPAAPALFAELRRIVAFWAARGVRIFRVDNPHTKPLAFWSWLIEDVRKDFPDALFLAEAFTRPAIMKTLAKIGFTQSYTYFTWRNTRAELTEYLTELASTDMKEYFTPNFFVSTPDILPRILVDGGRPAFRLRLVLAATLSPTYGIYSGYELCENAAIPHHAFPDDVEYADSEKYEIKVRDWNAPGHIKADVARLNRIRRDHPALQELDNLAFHPCDNPQILFFSKTARGGSDILLVAVNLDPHRPQEGHVDVPCAALNLGQSYEVRDLLSGSRWTWGPRNYVRLDPQAEPAHILRVERPVA